MGAAWSRRSFPDRSRQLNAVKNARGAADRYCGRSATVKPSVKGSLFVTGVAAVRRYRDAGLLSEDQIAVRLGPVALEMLDQKIDISRWYPIEAFCEMVDIDWEIAAGRDPDYMRRLGAVAARRFFERGIYQQLDYAKRAERVGSRRSLVRQAKLIATITNSLYSFIEVDVRVTSDLLEIVYGNAALLYEALRYTTEGFMNEVNRWQGSSRRWESERVAPDRVHFRLELPERLLGDD